MRSLTITNCQDHLYGNAIKYQAAVPYHCNDKNEDKQLSCTIFTKERKKSNSKFIISISPANFFASGENFFSIILPLIQSFNYTLFVNRKLHALIFFSNIV